MTRESADAKKQFLFRGRCLVIRNGSEECFFSLEGVKSPPPPNAHIHPEETPSADYLQSIVIETKDGAAVEIYNSPNSYGGVKEWEMGGGWEAHLVSWATSGWFTSSSLQQAEVNRGHLAGRQADPPAPPTSLLSRTALLFVMVPLERSVSRFFNAKWAKIRRFLPIQWIDFLLWSVQGPIINVYLLLMAVYKTVHIIPGLMNVHAGNCQFVYVGYASSRNCVWALSVCVLKEHWSVECFLTGSIYKLSVHLPSIMPIRAI